ncbi:MAG: ester cyclase [Chloroflexi bacterium]|nr:ester cyclase [Chloroflexota bacterium]
MTQTTEQLINNLMTAWNAHDADGVAAFYAPDYEEVDVAQAAPQHGPDAVRRIMLYYLRAFPDLQITLDDLIVNGNRAVMVWTWHGTQQGRVMNIPPTGRRVCVRGTSVLTIEGGQIRRGIRIWDVAGLLRSVGLLTEL